MTFIDFIYINLVTGELQVEPYDESISEREDVMYVHYRNL